jgi:SanA protein
MGRILGKDAGRVKRGTRARVVGAFWTEMVISEKMGRRLRGWGKGLVLSGLAGLVFFLWCRSEVIGAGEGRIMEAVVDVPECEVALVLGCSRLLSGKWENRYFNYRIDAVAELFEAGKVKHILVSGDNSRTDYDEPSDMKLALIERGIPEDRIHCDYAGFRTLDSVVRAKEVFQQDRFVIVSQEFHVQRALYLAREKGIEAYGYVARDVKGERAQKTKWREELARVKAVLDVKFLGTDPKFLGEPVLIGAREGEG